MPPGKPRSKEDTWREEDLKKSLKAANDDRRRHKDKDRDDRKKERSRDVNGEDKERRRRKEEDGERRHKDRNESRDKEEKKSSRHRDDEDDEERRRRREERKKKHENEDDDERRKRREERKKREEEEGRKKRDDGDDRERRHRRKDEDEDKERRRRHREKDEGDDKEKRRHHREEGDERKHRKRDEKRDEDGHRRHRDKENSEDRRNHRDKEKDEDRERRHRRHEDGSREKPKEADDKERRHRRKEDGSKEQRNGDEDERRRRHRDGEDGDERERRRAERKERHRRREEEEKENELKKKSSTETSTAKSVTTDSKLQNGDDADDDDYNYEDEEFEDYDDDFEDESEGDQEDESSETSSRQGPTNAPKWDINDPDPEKREMAEVLRAMNEENTRIMSGTSRNYSDDDSEPRYDRRQTQQSKSKAGRSFINFVSAKQRQMSRKAASKAKQRGHEILKLVDLDVTAFDMFDLPPVREYDMYIMNFGRSNTKQAYVQTNEDNIEREIQTEEIDVRTKWCQHPPEDYTACGAADGEELDDDGDVKKKEQDTSRLGTFIQKAGQVIAIILEEELAHKNQQELGGSQSNISLSDNFVQLGAPSFLQSRHVVYSCFSPIQSYLLLTVHSKPEQPSSRDRWRKYGIVCVWNVNEPSRPQKVLICASQPICCCFSPKKATLAFAGMRDGSVVVWDLRETSSYHRSENIDGQEWVFRHPTYSTAGVTGSENHHSCVVSVLPIISPTESVKYFQQTGTSAKSSLLDPAKNEHDLGTGLSFQLASLEESAILHVWVVAEITNPDMAGSESDLGLAPGGRIKLLRSSSIKLENPVRDPILRSPLHAFDMQLLPSDPNHFYVGTDSGSVVHGVRHSGRAPPKSFRPEVESPVDIVSIDFSPFDQPVFLIGCGDGSLRLHNINFEHPIMSWPNATGGKRIMCVQWSKSRPSVFYVIDESSLLHVFDLVQNDAAPQISERISKSRVTSFCLSNDHSATGLGLPGRQPQMVTTSADGAIEVHNISKQYAVAQLDEVYQFASYLEQAL